MDKPIPEINWTRVKCGDTTRVLPAEWAAIITFIKFRNLQAKLVRSRKTN